MSKRLTRRQMLAVLGIGAAAGLAAACQMAPPAATPAPAPQGGEKDAEAPQPTQALKGAAPTTVTYVDSDFGTTQTMASVQPIVDALNQKMADEGVPVQLRIMLLDNRKEKYPLLYAGGTPFTFAFDAPWLFMTSLIEQGNLKAIEGLLPEFPNINKAYTKEVMDANYTSGHIYGLPTFFYVGPTAGVIYRKDLLDKYGMPEPKSFEDLEAYMDEVKKTEKNIPAPFAAPEGPGGSGWNLTVNAPWRWYRAKDHSYIPSAAAPAGLTIKDALFETPTYVDYETTDAWKVVAERDRYWNEKGFFNKKPGGVESWNVFEQLFFPGKAAVVMAAEPQIYIENIFEKNVQQFVPEAKLAAVELTGAEQGFFINWASLRQWNFQVFNNAVPDEETKAGLKFFDWLLSNQDNVDIWLFGIDGKNYAKKPDLRFVDLEGVDAAANYRRQWYVSGVPGKFQRIPESASDKYVRALDLMTNMDYVLLNPVEQVDPDRKPVEIELGKLDAAGQEMTAEVMIKLSIEEAQAKYKKAMDDAGRMQVKEYLQKDLDKWLTDNKDKYEEIRNQSQAKFKEWEQTRYAEWVKANPQFNK